MYHLRRILLGHLESIDCATALFQGHFRRHLRVYCWPSVSGVIPNDFWQYLVLVTPFFGGAGGLGEGIGGGSGANRGGWPVAARCDWRPNKMPKVTAMGMASSAALTRMRIVMAGSGKGKAREGEKTSVCCRKAAEVNERASSRVAEGRREVLDAFVEWMEGEAQPLVRGRVSDTRTGAFQCSRYYGLRGTGTCAGCLDSAVPRCEEYMYELQAEAWPSPCKCMYSYSYGTRRRR